MSRWIGFFLCLILGLVMLALGLLVPAHLRGVNLGVLHQAGKTGPSLVDKAELCLAEQKLGPAQLLLEAARLAQVPGTQELGLALGNLGMNRPELLLLGSPDPRLVSIIRIAPEAATNMVVPFTDLVVQQGVRDTMVRLLEASPRPAVQRLMDCRSLTNTVLFAPSWSSSGQALDTALVVGGSLMDGGYLTKEISDELVRLTSLALAGQNSQRLEQALLDFLSLGQRMNWGQLAMFTGEIRDIETLRLNTTLVRSSQARLPVLFAALAMSNRPADVAKYLMTHSRTGFEDVRLSLAAGSNGLRELLDRQQPVNQRTWTRALEFGWFKQFANWARELDLRLHVPAIGLKWLLYFCSGFLLAAAVHYSRAQVSRLEQPLQVTGFHFVRESLFGLGFLLAVLLFTEPFIAADSQKVDYPFSFRLPGLATVSTLAATKSVSSNAMNQLSLLTLLLFFVLQALIYTACLIKLAEIRRQNVPPGIKLKLLDNEDHLFDAGLYLGFVGTIISLILVSLGVIRPSLMAAYSSTSFGILFVSVFKIFNLRPTRRRLLLEAEMATHYQTTHAGVRA